MRKHNAFTMMELAIVLAVIGILAAILIPVLSNVITKANAKSALTDARHIAEQYVMNVFEKKGAPETMVIVIEKGGVYWLFGYDRDAAHNGNRLMISKQNPYKEKDFMKNDAANAVMDNWSFNSRHEGTAPDNTGATQYVPNVDGTFWLVPYYDNGAKVYEVRDITPTAPSYDNEKYMVLNTSASVDVGDNAINASYTADGEDLGKEGDILAYHGMLLPGTFTYDEEEVNTTAPDGTDMNTTYYTLSFLMGDTEGKFNPTDYDTTLPASVQIPAGTTVYPSTYKITNLPPHYTYQWDRATAFRMNRNMTLTAEWTEKPSYTVSFNVGDGETFNAGSLTTAKATMEGAGFTWTETTSGPKTTAVTLTNGSSKLYAGTSIAAMFNILAEKDGHTFQGWKTATGSTINSSSGASEKTVTGNMDFSAVFVDTSAKLHVIINANNGNSEQNIDTQVEYGSTMTLNTTTLGIDAPSGKVLEYWSWSLSGTTFGNGASVTFPNDSSITEVTITANWANDELIIHYATDIPSAASAAGLSASVPSDVAYTSATKPNNINIGDVHLSWYTVSTYTVTYPGGSDVLTNNADYISFDISGISSGTVTITPNYTAMTVTIQYRNGGYNVDNWDGSVPAAHEYTLLEIKDGYTVCTSDLTCNEGYRFEGWITTTTDVYAPGATYPISESLNGQTVTFLAYFNEEVMATACRIVFNFYDYENYPIADKASHIFFTKAMNVPFTYTLDGALMEGNMPTKQELRDESMSIIVTSAGGAEYECELYYDYTAEYNGDYEPITVSASTPQDTVVWIPSYAAVEINNEPYYVVWTKEGFKNIDHGTVIVNGDACSPTMGNNYVLANDITLSGNTHPLGFQGENNPHAMWIFEGKFNGLGHTISGFHFDPGVNNDYVGLFSSTASTTVLENFKLEVDGTIKGYEFSGAVTGDNDGTIRNVIVDFAQDYSVSGWIIVGGICGRNGGTIDSCHITVSGGTNKHIVARGYQVTDFAVDGYNAQNDEVVFGGSGNPEVSLTGAFIGGIAGGNDFGTITKCSANGIGIHAEQTGEANDYYGRTRKLFTSHQGGIAGASVGGMVDQCWTRNVKIGMGHTTIQNNQVLFTDNVAGLMSLGGIVGTCNRGTVQHCWSRNANIAGAKVIGGLVAMISERSTVSDCWVYSGTTANGDGFGTLTGDFTATSCIDGNCSVSGAIWDALYTGTIPSGVTNYPDGLANQTPSSVGLSGTYYYAHENGPMLTNNPYSSTWILG